MVGSLLNMKTFQNFLIERYNVPVVPIITTGADINIPEVKNELNRNIDLIFTKSFITVEEAVNKLRKILSMYNLDLPQVDSNDTKHASVVLSVGHHHLGYDEFTGKVPDFVPSKLRFEYKLIDGLYKCSAELL